MPRFFASSTDHPADGEIDRDEKAANVQRREPDTTAKQIYIYIFIRVRAQVGGGNRTRWRPKGYTCTYKDDGEVIVSAVRTRTKKTTRIFVVFLFKFFILLIL